MWGAFVSYLKNELSIETSCAYIIEQENILGCFKNTNWVCMFLQV